MLQARKKFEILDAVSNSYTSPLSSHEHLDIVKHALCMRASIPTQRVWTGVKGTVVSPFLVVSPMSPADAVVHASPVYAVPARLQHLG